jgi:hypothetical protein
VAGGSPGLAESRSICFLTLSEIVAFRSSGAWLQVDHLVESIRIWLRGHDHHADGRLRVK